MVIEQLVADPEKAGGSTDSVGLRIGVTVMDHGIHIVLSSAPGGIDVSHRIMSPGALVPVTRIGDLHARRPDRRERAVVGRRNVCLRRRCDDANGAFT